MPWCLRRVVLTTCVALQWCALPLRAQWQSNTGPAGAALGAVVGGDVERYVRALAMAGIIRPVAWGARGFGPDELSGMLRDGTSDQHPWQSTLRAATQKRASLGTVIFTSVNSAAPWGDTDGAMWQGRGVNASVGVSATWHVGRLTAVAAPLTFIAQNASFSQLTPPPYSRSPFANPLFPLLIDLPQRMGNRPYARLDPGESSITLRAARLEIQLSTASVGWGVGESFPAVLGANAGGFPHLAIGPARQGVTVNRIGRFSGRYILGVMQQSAWSPAQGSPTYVDANQTGTRRIAVGVSASFMPTFAPTLEIGASRFYHSPFLSGRSRWDAWSKPFEGLFKKGFSGRSSGLDPLGDTDNQLASLFVRWVFPKRGVEASAELLREDHNYDSRDLALEPDNNSAIMASIRTTTSKTADKLAILTLEYFDGDIKPIAQAREQGFLYLHGGLLQGHTQRGQLLGAPIGAGAIAGERIAWESFTSAGSTRVNLQRWRTRSIALTDSRGLYVPPDFPVPGSHDWVLDGSVSRTRYRDGRALTIEGGLAWWGRFNFDDSLANLYGRATWSIF